jgi:Domain of unknown function (DUF4124)
MLKLKSLIPCAVMLVSLCMTGAAMAQFKWKDGNGRWVYSDQPPPSNAVAAAPFSGDALPKSLNNKSAAPSKSGKDDKDLAAKRTELDKQAALKTKQEKQETDQKIQASCEKDKASLATIQSGVRVKMTESNGDFKVLNDSERQAQIAELQKGIASNCKG